MRGQGMVGLREPAIQELAAIGVGQIRDPHLAGSARGNSDHLSIAYPGESDVDRRGPVGAMVAGHR